MPKTIIVPFDGSSASVRAHGVATRLADRIGRCDVVLLAAAEDDTDAAEIRSVASRFGLHDELEVFHSHDPAGVIVDAGRFADEPVVCMATHGRGRAAALLGSVATDVLRRSAGPLLLVGPHCERNWLHDPPRVLTCWSGVGSSAVLPYAKEWATILGAELWLELVFHPLDVVAAENPGAQFAPALELLGVADVHLRSGASEYPAGALVASSKELPATLVAMTTHARRGVARTVLGSVAMDVVHHAPCPVLVTRRH